MGRPSPDSASLACALGVPLAMALLGGGLLLGSRLMGRRLARLFPRMKYSLGLPVALLPPALSPLVRPNQSAVTRRRAHVGPTPSATRSSGRSRPVIDVR